MTKSWASMLFSLALVIIVTTSAFVIFKKKVNLSNGKNSQLEVMETENKQIKLERVSFKTEDGVEIISDFARVDGSKFAGILLHMMPESRKSYTQLAAVLNQAGYSTLAVDLRGHGESTNSTKGRLDYKKFNDSDHQASRFDVAAASNFLKSQGFAKDNQFLIGASIGANLALQFLSENQEAKAVVLLSPGLNYHGILTEPLEKKSYADKVMLVAASDDSYSASTVKTLKNNAEVLIYPNGGHGTDILRSQKDAMNKIINWLKTKLI